MRTSFKVLSVSAALASMAVCLPTEYFKRDLASVAKLAMCLPRFVADGTWGADCQAAAAFPGLLPATKLNQLTLDFTTGEAPLASSTEIVGSLIEIPGVTLPATKIKYKVDLSFDGAVIGTVDTPYADTSVTNAALTIAMAPVVVIIDAKAQAGFAAFMTAIVTKDSVIVPLEGKMDISFNFKSLLEMQPSVKVVSGIGYQTTTVFPGLKGLPDIKVVSLIANTPDADKKTQTISFKVNINVASNLSVKLGDVEFNAAGPAGPIGTTTFKALTLAHGDNTIEAVTVVDLSLAGAADFVSGLSTADATLTLTGFADSTTNPLTVTAVEALKLTVVIPKQSTPAA
ncbi:hypothetical protein BG005_009112 [Podila minutissima]|nr:hypothetical protein BG005_009112 [Podila minutissima]